MPVTTESIQQCLDYYFPNEPRNQEEELQNFCNEMLANNISIDDLKTGCRTVVTAFHGDLWIEASAHGLAGDKLTQIGYARFVLRLTHEQYWQWRKKDFPEDWITEIETLRKKKGITTNRLSKNFLQNT